MILFSLNQGTMEIPIDELEETLKLAKKCELYDLISDIEDRLKKTMSWGMNIISMGLFGQNNQGFFF